MVKKIKNKLEYFIQIKYLFISTCKLQYDNSCTSIHLFVI